MQAAFHRLKLCALGLFCACATAAAQTPDASRFPTKPIRLIVPFPPGGSNDILGRFLAQKMSDRLGQQTIVDNRAGADGIIGTELAARAPADGHTLVIVSTSYTMNPAIHKLPYDPVKSLAPISLIASGGNVIAVHPSLPIKTVKELIAVAKAKPGQLRYASSGIGGFNHFGGELFNTMAGVKLVHVPYKGGGPAMLDVMSGQVEMTFCTLIQALPHMRSGKLKALGVGSARRSPLLPEVPTIAETLPGYARDGSHSLLAPAGTPRPVLVTLSKEVARILDLPEVKERLKNFDFVPAPTTPEEHDRIIRADIATFSGVVSLAGLRPR